MCVSKTGPHEPYDHRCSIRKEDAYTLRRKKIIDIHTQQSEGGLGREGHVQVSPEATTRGVLPTPINIINTGVEKMRRGRSIGNLAGSSALNFDDP